MKLLVLLLLLSCLVSSLAVPSTRSLKPNTEEDEENALSIRFLLQGEEDAVGVEVIEGRMEIESADYPDPGANNHHDPSAPGRT